MVKGKYIIIAVVAFLLGLTVIQFVWINKMATQYNKQFEYTVVAALRKAVYEVDARESVCWQVTDCFNKNNYKSCTHEHLNQQLWVFIDSILKSELTQSRICLNYEFQLTTSPHPHFDTPGDDADHKCFTIRSNMTTKNNEFIWYHVTFPSRSTFILTQIGWLFGLSLMLILLTIWAFVLIYRFYLQERNLASDTRNFINNLTHELKTPISAIRLANSRIVKSTAGVIDTAAYTGIIDHENKKLENHVNYLLDLSRLQKGKIPLQPEAVNVHELIEQLASGYQLQIDERKGTLNLQLNAANPILWADSFHLTNALSYLIDNAFKYSPQAPVITLNTENKRQQLVIAITDKGLGIDKADQKNIFNEFSRVNTGNVHNIKGFGLGLAYVAQVVKMHKGQIWLKSALGQGSTFFVQMPLTVIK